MFSFFKKKDKRHEISDLVFATHSAKLQALADVAAQHSQQVFIAWFEDSKEKLTNYFQQKQIQSEVISYRQVHTANLHTQTVIFIEHYPLAIKEAELFETMAEKSITVYSSLDDPLFLFFGGDKIASLLTNLGMNDNEAISHSMITRSIQNAQHKLSKKVITEHSATSVDEWFRKNVTE